MSYLIFLFEEANTVYRKLNSMNNGNVCFCSLKINIFTLFIVDLFINCELIETIMFLFVIFELK